MKRIITNAILLFISVSLFAQFEVGSPVLEVLYVGQYDKLDDCAPDEDVNIGLDIELMQFLTGVELILVISDISIPEGELMTHSGLLAVNDTLVFSGNQEFHTFFLTGYGSFEYSILARGIPEILGEEYPCVISEIRSLPTCLVGINIQPDFFSETCQVQEGTVASNYFSSAKNELLIYPNPSNGITLIKNNSQHPIRSLSIYNSLGQLHLHREMSNDENEIYLDLTRSVRGIYQFKIDRESGVEIRNVIIN